MSDEITEEQLVYELAVQSYINKDKGRQLAGMEFPDPNRQWRSYRDEWFLLSEDEKDVWISEATIWLNDWKKKHSQYYDVLIRNAKPLYSLTIGNE